MSPRRVLIGVALALAMLVAVPTIAAAVTPQQSRAATGTYNLDFTLPTAGKSGCEVCHADKNLVRIVDGQARSMYVDSAQLKQSAHAKLACTQCHVDFAYKMPHENVVKGNAWKETAKLSCKNSGCHPQEFNDVSLGAHSMSRQVGVRGDNKPRPLCGDCHGGHNIQRLKDNPEALASLRSQEITMCGECHPEQAGSYADYYHGAAYRRGATDAPSCSQCHRAHEVLPSGDRRSPTYDENLVDTCAGSEAGGSHCHTSVNREFVSYADLIHNRQQVESENPAWNLFDTMKKSIEGTVQQVRSWFG